MFLAVLLALPIGLLPQTQPPTTRMTLKNGTVYVLKEPPRISGGRIIFTTSDGKVFSLSESEVESIGDAPRPTVVPRRTTNPQDSRDLGQIAREQRESRGKSSEISSRATRPAKASRRPKPTRTPRPAASRTPAPTAGTKSRG